MTTPAKAARAMGGHQSHNATTLTRHVGLSAECSEPQCPGDHARHARVAHCSGRRFCPRCHEPETTPASPETIRAIRARKEAS